MSRFTKLLIGFLVFTVLVLAVVSIAAQIYLAPFVRQQIEEKGSAALGAPIRIDTLSIGLFPPLTANASDIEFSIPAQGITGRISRLSLRARFGLTFDIKRAISDLKIRVVEPVITYDLSAKTIEPKTLAPTSEKATGDAAENSPASEIIADLEIENGRIDIIENGKLKYQAEDFNLSTRFAGLTAPTKFRAQLKLSAPEYLRATKVPVALASDFLFDGTNFSTQATSLDVAQIKASLSGNQNLKSGDGEWAVKAESRNFAADTTVADLKVKGAITGELNANFILIKNSPSLRALVLAIDLSSVELGYKNLFKKPASVPLVLDARGTTEGEYFKLESAKAIFDRLQASFAATIPLPTSKLKSSNITFNFSRTALSGWEKFFPALSQAPVTGFLEGAGGFEGNLQDLKSYKISIKPLKFEKISADLNWQSEDKTKTLRGPISLDGSVDLALNGTNLESAKADLVADLTKMQIEIKDTFSKRASVVFRTELHATQRNLREIELKKTAVLLGTNQLVLSGTIQEPQKPKLNLTVSAPKLSITELSSMLLSMKKYALTGNAKGSFKVTGVYDFAGGIEKSPLSVSGNLSAEIPTLKCPSAPANASAGTSNKEAVGAQGAITKPEPMLPPWPVARTAVVTSLVSIKQLSCKGVEVTGINWAGRLNKGLLTGSVKIQKVFDGKLVVRNLKTNLSEAQPNTEASVKIDGVDVNQAMTWFSPTWKDMIKGRLYGTSQLFAPDSSRPDFLENTRLQGSTEVRNAFISTLQLDQMINQAIAKIPGLEKKEAVNSKGVAATVTADYLFEKSVMNLKKFTFLSPDKNEINATGTVDINKNAKISGIAYLATAPIGGSIKAANSDSQGRLVLPFELNGNLMSPSVSFAEKTLEKLAENTAKKELDNLKSRAQEQGKKELEKKFEELKKKGLKGLFGK